MAIVGSGYTGLNAALETARAGRNTLVLDALALGGGCSSRNGGQVSPCLYQGADELAKRYGAELAAELLAADQEAMAWVADAEAREGIDCDFKRSGLFHAAHSPHHFEDMARKAVTVVPRADQRRELGTDAYFGGVVYPEYGSLNPAKYHDGLLRKAHDAGAQFAPHCAVTDIQRTASGFRVRTALGEVIVQDVVIATNGYATNLNPWLARRIIPIGSYVIATQALPKELISRLFPTDRMVTDSRKVVYYFRASPDGTRVIFGGRVSATETDPAISGPKLHREMCRLFPELSIAKISHSWMGKVAYTFGEMPHFGCHEGLHFAHGYCGSGIAMSSYLGMKIGRKVLGLKDGETPFEKIPHPTRPLYRGRPWFLPAAVGAYRLRDRAESWWAHRRA